MVNADKVFYMRAYVNGSFSDVTVYVDGNGYISDVKFGKGGVSGSYEFIDLTCPHCITLPGFIDLHTHLRDFELSYKETVGSGTAAAVSSGYTLVCDMPNTKPFINNVDLIVRRVELARRESYADYGLFSGIPDELNVLNDLITYRGYYVGFKIYPEDLYSKYSIIRELLKSYDGLVVVHGELPDFVNRDLMHELKLRYLDRPSWSELTVVKILLDINRCSKIHLTHSAHPTAPYYSRLWGFTVDTTPAYFMLSSDDVRSCWEKVNPPIGDALSTSAIFRNVIQGCYDAIVSDHAPHTPSEKGLDWRVCPSGIALIEASSRVLITLAIKGFLSVDTLVHYLSKGPARLLGVSKFLGGIDVGFRASFTVIDVSREGVIKSKFSKAPKTGVDGYRYRGEVIKTVVGGVVVYDSGELVSKPNCIILGGGGVKT